MSKKIKGIAKLIIKYKNATPAPPIGSILGSRGINIMNFCKEFNLRSEKENLFEKGTLVTVFVTIYINNEFTFFIKTPPTSFLLKKILKIEKGSNQPNKKFVAKITDMQLNKIIKSKYKDLTSYTFEKAKRTIIGSIKSMGISIIS